MRSIYTVLNCIYGTCPFWWDLMRCGAFHIYSNELYIWNVSIFMRFDEMWCVPYIQYWTVYMEHVHFDEIRWDVVSRASHPTRVLRILYISKCYAVSTWRWNTVLITTFPRRTSKKCRCHSPTSGHILTQFLVARSAIPKQDGKQCVLFPALSMQRATSRCMLTPSDLSHNRERFNRFVQNRTFR